MKKTLAYQFIVLVLSVWLLNQLSDRYTFRIDLTEEKRYTVSEVTKVLLQNLTAPIFFEVYLAGDLPSNFERFQKAIREMLEQFEEASGNLVSFKFTDPLQAGSSKAQNEYVQSLAEKGLQPTSLRTRKESQSSQMLIVPGAIASRGGKEVAVNLLKGNRAAGPEEILNQSIEGLEYELASAIKDLVRGGIPKVGYITGHGSPDSLDLQGFKNTVLTKFDLFMVSLEHKKELMGYDAIVIGKPIRPFSEPEKYLLDQYLMRGGNLLFFIDALRVNMDSALAEGTVAIPYETNLSDLLFRYGIRINNDFVLDVNSGQLSVVTGNVGNQPQIQMLPWPFFPVISNFSKHPSVRNLDAILARFMSSVDTVKAAGVKKVPLMTSSPYTKILGPPVKVALNDLRDELRPERFTDQAQTVGYLLEGDFTSLYANRLIPKMFDKQSFIEKSNGKGKVIVVADGDLIRNELDPKTNEPLGMGVEPFTNTTYANEAFVLNMLEYVVDEEGLMEARTREVKIRPLDKVKVKKDRTTLQILNIALPVLIVVLFGALKWYLRKKAFAK